MVVKDQPDEMKIPKTTKMVGIEFGVTKTKIHNKNFAEWLPA